ncbi:hypothetical protein C0991_003960 [Blastosporella zonata]|nr:hypothetical protein C0991_003960 [Blastosporella zonata]
MAPRRRCPTCGSRQWHKEPSSGLIACSEGHVLQNYRNEATEAEDIGQHALRKRTLKSGRKKKEPGSRANPSLYHGARARYHYFECLQLILRKQVAALVKLWALPQEFEVICRDIWALHIDLLPNSPSAEPYYYAQELRNEDSGEGASKSKADNASEESDSDEDGEKPSSEDDERDDMEGRDEDPELTALLRANSDAEESSDSGDEGEMPKHKGKIKGRSRGRKIYEGPASTIAVLIVGCWTLRVPVLCRDFKKQHAPSTQALHGLASRLSKMMYTSYGIFTPEANAAPILWRVVSQGLGGTPMLYRLTKRLGQILSLPLTLHHTLAPGLEKRKTYDPERHVYDSVAPEVSLMAAGIVVLKLVYGLDGQTRFVGKCYFVDRLPTAHRTPRDETDVACGLARADEFLAGLRRLDAEDEAGQATDALTKVYMGDMSTEMIDAYLDFGERVLIGDGGRAGGPVLERFFAVAEGREGGQEGRASSVASLHLEAIIAQDEGMRPGEGRRTGHRRARCPPRRPAPLIAVMRRFVAAFKRDKHVPPPLVTDHAPSSASSSSGCASLYLQTPDDDQQLPAAVNRQESKKSWRLWLKGSNKKQLPEWVPSHDVNDSPSEPSLEDEPPGDPVQPFLVLVKNSIQPPPLPALPFSHCADVPYIFPKSVNLSSSLSRPNSFATALLKRRLLKRLQDDHHTFIKSELRSIAFLALRSIEPVAPVKQPPHPFNESVPSKTTSITPSCPGLGNWVSRPCFEDRYDLFLPEQDGAISRHPVVGSNLAVAALEFSEGIEAMVDFDLIQTTPQLVIDVPSETLPSPPSSSGHSRNLPYIAVPSPLRNEHNLPRPPVVSATQSAPPIIPASLDPMSKRGVRFADDGKDDVIPLGYVLRMKKKREEKAKFLKSEQERRSLEEERMRIEEERRKQAAERAEWEIERKAWEKEKRAMEEERRQRKYAEEVVAARLRRESQRAGGVPSLKSSESNTFLGSTAGAGYFSASASSSTSERNKPPIARRHSRPVYDDSGAPVYLPRREASEPNLPTRTSMNSPASFPITPSPRGSLASHSPNSSRPPSVNKDPGESSSPLPGTRSPSVYSSQEVSSSSEDVKAAVAAAAKRAKRSSLAASISAASRNNSSTSLLGDRAISYPVWTGSNHSLNNMVPPVPMIPMQLQMMPMPAYAMMDMPLLPPTPPFMLQQYTRPHGSPGSSGSGGGGSPKGRLGGSPNSSREHLGSQNSSRERVNVIGGSGRSGSGERSSSESRGPPPRSASPRHAPISPAGSGPGSTFVQPYQRTSSPAQSSRRASMPVPPPQSYSPQKRPRQSSYDTRPTHSHSQPAMMPPDQSAQHLQPPSPWTGVPTQSGKLPNGNSNGGGTGARSGGHTKTVPPRHQSYSGVRSEGVRMSNMRTEPPRQAKRPTIIS